MNITRILSAAVLVLLAACAGPKIDSDPDPDPPPDPPPPPAITYSIRAPGFTAGRAFFWMQVHRVEGDDFAGRTVVTDAVVSVNGTDGTFNSTTNQYTGTLPDPLAPGDAVELTIQVGDQTIVGSLAVPDAPVITTPVGTYFPAADPVTIDWTIASDPDRYALLVVFPSGSNTWNYEEDGSARSFDLMIPDSVPLDGDFSVRINAENRGSFTGPAHPRSEMTALNASGSTQIVIGP